MWEVPALAVLIPLTTLALVAVMFYEDWQLALVAFFAFPTAIFPIRRIGRRMRKVSDHRQTHVGRLTNLLDGFFKPLESRKGVEGMLSRLLPKKNRED